MFPYDFVTAYYETFWELFKGTSTATEFQSVNKYKIYQYVAMMHMASLSAT